MFSRLKGAIDSRIAEEQARQRQAQLSAQQATRTPPRRRPQGQNGSGSQRTPSRQRDHPTNLPAEKGPDPSEFEPEFAVGTDESAVPSRVATPQQDVASKEKEPATEKETPTAEDARGTSNVAELADGSVADISGTALGAHLRPQDLPTEVRVKLRKLERMESKYADLLRAYRTAHARIQTVESFEAALRENTPLTSINDPNALVEYLNQITLKSDMVLDELKRVSADRDDYNAKFQASEEKAKTLIDEVAELRKKETETEPATSQNPPEVAKRLSIGSPQVPLPGDNASVKDLSIESEHAKSPSTTSRIASFSLFSPRSKPMSPSAPKETSEEFFSFDSEQVKMEGELVERQAEVEELKRQVTNLKGDLKVARESTESMVESLETATRELHGLREAKDKFDQSKAELQKQVDELETKMALDSVKAEELEKELVVLGAKRDEMGTRVFKLETEIKQHEESNSQLRRDIETSTQDTNILNEKLSQKDSVVKDLEDTLAMYKSAERQEAAKKTDDQSSEKKLSTMQNIMDTLRGQLDKAETTVAELREEIRSSQADYSSRPSTQVLGFLDEGTKDKLESLNSREEVVRYLSDNFGLEKSSSLAPGTAQPLAPSPAPSEAGTGASKKKNKKKKKGKGAQNAAEDNTEADAPVKVSENLAEVEGSGPAVNDKSSEEEISKLEQEISELRREMSTKSDTIERLSKQLKDQDELKEEIETLRDDLLHQGQEHVEARDALKEAQRAKSALQESVDNLEKELLEARAAVAGGADKEKIHQEIASQHDELKKKCSTLETELAAAEQLAAGRFKDITDLKELLAKAQPELRSLRNEVAELKAAKDDLKNKTGELNRLESRYEDIKAELKGLSKRLGDKDAEIKELLQKIEQETTTRTRIERDVERAQLDLQTSETRRQETTTHTLQLEKDLSRTKEESTTLRAKLRTLDDQLTTSTRETTSLRGELTLKSALHTTSQSLISSLRDQTHELTIQAREATTRADTLDEELVETQRMLTERTREGQTMRMLLDQSTNGMESRLREMKERMDKALEERDRVEDEANVAQRRMMREVEESRNKARDASRGAKVLEDERDELEVRLKEWKRRKDELEGSSARAVREVEDIKAAMTGLREALDESERQVRDLEVQKSELRRVGEEAKERVEKLTRANRNLTEEVKSAQARAPPPGRPGAVAGVGRVDSNIPSSRTSIDSTHANARSPAPMMKEKGPSTTTSRRETPTTAATGNGNVGLSQGTVDYVYLKNVLLQFLEQRDKGHQRQLVPVLGMLLHFDRKDEQKWMAAISAR